MLIFLNGYVYQGYYSWGQKSSGTMCVCYCSEVLMCEASLLRSSLEWILHDWILTNHSQIYCFSLFGAFEKIWGSMRNCGKWSEMVAVKFLNTTSWEI